MGVEFGLRPGTKITLVLLSIPCSDAAFNQIVYPGGEFARGHRLPRPDQRRGDFRLLVRTCAPISDWSATVTFGVPYLPSLAAMCSVPMAGNLGDLNATEARCDCGLGQNLFHTP